MKKSVNLLLMAFCLAMAGCHDDVEIAVEPRLNPNDSIAVLDIYQSLYPEVDIAEVWPDIPYEDVNASPPKVNNEKYAHYARLCKLFMKNATLVAGPPIFKWELDSLSNEYFAVEFYFEGTGEETIPSSFGNLTHLRIFEYYPKGVDGNLPVELFNCPLEVLLIDCRKDPWGGPSPKWGNPDFIPAEFINLAPTLQYLYISNTQLSSGRIFEHLDSFKSLWLIYLCFNNFTGRVPLLEFDSDDFWLDGNLFTEMDWGYFEQMANYDRSYCPYLKSNLLQGEIPEFVLKTPWLKNQLYGRVGRNRFTNYHS